MEARFRADARQFYDAGPSSINNLRKKSLEWDLNDWRWDGDRFLATPLNAGPSECRNKQLSNGPSSCFEEIEIGIDGKGKGVCEKRRRIVVVDDEEHYDNGAGSLSLNLGMNAFPVAEADLANWEGNSEKKSKLQRGNSSRSPCCQVEGCVSDLSKAKDYHRRHKVCEMHAKASSATVNNVMQRFCQQCSRFHLLQEFDEGKRSCRRRLAGHNRRRRKSLPDDTPNVNSMTDDQTAGYLLISLLRILSNLQSDSSGQSNDQDLLSHLIKNLATLSASFDAKDLSGLMQASQDRIGTSAGNSEMPNGLIRNGVPQQASTKEVPSTPNITCAPHINGLLCRQTNHSVCIAAAETDTPSKKHLTEASFDPTVERVRLKEFDLNNAYSDAEHCMEVIENAASPADLGTGSPIPPSYLLQDYHQSSLPQMSVYSDSTSAQSRSSSNGSGQTRTDRIVFKLFGKDPNDFPLVLRSQILDWLSHSPTDIESYIRPGCVILTIYLHLAESAWQELCSDLSSNLNRLLYKSADNFWRTGWVYARIQHHLAFIYNGKVLLSTPRLLGSPSHFKIMSVSPVAAAISSRVNFIVKGLNLAHATGRLLCAFEGKYLVQETTQALIERDKEHEDSECLSFSCSLPDSVGRGFIEVEDNGLNCCFFPFIVAEDDICSEIRGLESVLDVDDELQERMNPMDTKTQALNFLNEMGWLLRRSQLRLTSKQVNPCSNVFSLSRFRGLIAFAMDQEWCAVVKSLLDLLFQGAIDIGGLSTSDFALSEGLLHTAVRKNCRSMIEFLLRYRPGAAAKEGCDNFLFRPDVTGPSNITPLHVAATVNGAESILDALTNDPGQFGLKAWRSARDSTGFTPEDHARSRGHESYLCLVQKKIDKLSNNGHVVLNILGSVPAPHTTCKQAEVSKYVRSVGLEIEKGNLKPIHQPYCNLCSQQLLHRSTITRSLLYRPAMLTMVGIAAVCVCVGLLFKGPPEVTFVFPPFRWEKLAYGSM